MRIHEDARAIRACNLFDGTHGDVNLFVLRPGKISAWHRHAQQIDQFVILEGKVRFGLLRPHRVEPEYVDPGMLDKLIVHPGTWHGYQNVGEKPAMLLMYLSHKYEDGWDEERRTLEEMPWNP